jgi:hypothetical protein
MSNSDRVITNQAGDLRVSSIPAGKELHRWKLPSEDRGWMLRAGRGILISMGGLFIGGSPKSAIYYSPDGEKEPQLLSTDRRKIRYYESGILNQAMWKFWVPWQAPEKDISEELRILNSLMNTGFS